MYKNLVILGLLFAVTNCSTLIKLPHKVTYCNSSKQQDAKQRVDERNGLFPALSTREIDRRQDIDLPYSGEKESVYPIMRNAIINADGGPYIPVDLRYYKSVNWGNMIYANISNNKLASFTKFSRFNQKISILFNINDDNIQIIPGKNIQDIQDIEAETINRSDLNGSEWVFNISNVGQAGSNIKFPKNVPYSIIADNVSKLSLDFREASHAQVLFGKKWTMRIYSLKNSTVVSGKDTNGIIDYIDNEGLKIVNIGKFNNIKVGCYTSLSGDVFY